MIKKIILCAVISLCFISSVFAVEWHELKSDHFIVFYKQAPFRFIQNVSARAEENYKKTTTSLGFTRYKGWIWGDRVKIYIYDDAQDYKKSSGLAWSAGSVMTKFKTIAAFPSAQGFFDSTLPHEIGHIIFRDFIGPDAFVPLWFEEGVAVFQEESGGWGADDVVRRAMAEGRFISLADLGSLSLNKDSDRELVRIFYAEAASLVGFLIHEGEMYRFARLCREIKDGTRFEGALKKAYMKYPTIDPLESAWKAYLSYEKKNTK